MTVFNSTICNRIPAYLSISRPLQNYHLYFQSHDSGLNSRLFLVTIVHVSIDIIIKFGGYIPEDYYYFLESDQEPAAYDFAQQESS
jgi:hypothetical protein